MHQSHHGRFVKTRRFGKRCERGLIGRHGSSVALLESSICCCQGRVGDDSDRCKSKKTAHARLILHCSERAPAQFTIFINASGIKRRH
eukprot:scaffold193016_cov59-Attheya_sp.AAC.2